MSDENEKIAELIRGGKYFDEARSWYGAMYIGPISERTFFLIVAVLSGIVAVASIFAVAALMPLSSKPGILVPAGARPEETVQSLLSLRELDKDTDKAIAKFFAAQYVAAREGYSAHTYQGNAAFVQRQSDEATYNVFSAQYSSSNPQSLAATFGEMGTRTVSVISVSLRGDTARVSFITEDSGVDPALKSQWTAKMDFHYTPMTTQMVTNPETGQDELEVKDPQFQVVNYALSQDK